MRRFLWAVIAAMAGVSFVHAQPEAGEKWTLQFTGASTMFEPNDYTFEGEYLFTIPASGSISAQGRATVHNPEWIVPKKVRIVSASDNWTNRKPNLTGQVEGKTVRFFAEWPSDSADGVVEMHFPPATKIPTKTEQQKIMITPKRHRFEMELADGKTCVWKAQDGPIEFTYTLRRGHHPLAAAIRNPGKQAKPTDIAKAYMAKENLSIKEAAARIAHCDVNDQLIKDAQEAMDRAKYLSKDQWETRFKGQERFLDEKVHGATIEGQIYIRKANWDTASAVDQAELLVHEMLHFILQKAPPFKMLRPNPGLTDDEQDQFIYPYLEAHRVTADPGATGATGPQPTKDPHRP